MEVLNQAIALHLVGKVTYEQRFADEEVNHADIREKGPSKQREQSERKA